MPHEPAESSHSNRRNQEEEYSKKSKDHSSASNCFTLTSSRRCCSSIWRKSDGGQLARPGTSHDCWNSRLPHLPEHDERRKKELKSLIIFAVGFGTGWAVRSIADSPHGVGVKVMEVACRTKDQMNKWFAVERERVADIMAEARSRSHFEEPTKSTSPMQNAA